MLGPAEAEVTADSRLEVLMVRRIDGEVCRKGSGKWFWP